MRQALQERKITGGARSIARRIVVLSLFHTIMLFSMLLTRSKSVAAYWVQRVPQASLTRSRLTTTTKSVSRIHHVKPFSASTTRCFATSDPNNDDSKLTPGELKRKYQKKKKFTVVDEITQKNVDKLAQAFDEMARKEGFDSSMSHFAADATFEDDFEDEEYGDDDDFDDDGDDDEDIEDSASEVDFLDRDSFDISDFGGDASSDDEDYLDFGPEEGGAADDMDARIAAAQNDMGLGKEKVSKASKVPTSKKDRYASDVSTTDLRQLGFRPEVNPFGNDETPRREQFKLVKEAKVCSACGADFQSHNEQKPGYLPTEKYEIQVKLGKIEDLQKLQEKAETADWSTDDEINWLLKTSGGRDDATDEAIDIDSMAQEMDLDLGELAQKTVICKRCHGLQNFGKVDDALRPGWTKEPLLSQQKFRDLLRPIRDKPAVIIALVDLFDFSGSVLPELDIIAGDNPVIIAANKADLLSSKMGPQRVESWVRRELEYLGIESLANIGGAVRLVSCKTGMGIPVLLEKARNLAEEMDCDVYVVGAANAGKSSLINYILRQSSTDIKPGKRRAGNENARKGAVTTSPLPGTTLKFIKVDLGGGRSLYDTPGLLVPGTLTQMLTPDELKMVVPKKEVEPVTFRVSAGKCVLIGGLARIELVGDCKPFLFTFFVSNDIKLHPTDSSRADEFIAKHVGEVLTPPLAPGPERMEQIGEFEDHILDIEGSGWKEAAADISLTGLGWIAVTGAGMAKVKISVPKGIGVSVRPPLMPMDIWETTAKYTGGRAVRKSTKTAGGKRRKGVGRR